MRMLVAIAALCLPLLSLAEDIEWRAWSPAVFEEARREGRLVLLDLTAEWCRFCRKMDEITYRDGDVMAAILEDYVPVRADEKEQPALARRYAGHGRPLTVVFDASGREILVKSGYLEPQWMVWLLQAVAADPDPAAHH